MPSAEMFAEDGKLYVDDAGWQMLEAEFDKNRPERSRSPADALPPAWGCQVVKCTPQEFAAVKARHERESRRQSYGEPYEPTLGDMFNEGPW